MDIDKIIGQMTLEDKIALCSGETFWETKKYEKYGIPSLFMCDGPHGLRKQERENGADMLGVNESRPSTCFPAEVTTASSWDPELLTEIGHAIGEEAKEQGVGWHSSVRTGQEDCCNWSNGEEYALSRRRLQSY
ncbi:hypothetical protein [Blautia sp.]